MRDRELSQGTVPHFAWCPLSVPQNRSSFATAATGQRAEAAINDVKTNLEKFVSSIVSVTESSNTWNTNVVQPAHADFWCQGVSKVAML